VSTLEPAERTATQQMQMHVFDCLAGLFSGIDNHPKAAFGYTLTLGQQLDRLDHRRPKVWFTRFKITS